MAITVYPPNLSIQRAVFLSSATWVVPSGVVLVKAFLVGGGAGGGPADESASPAIGGNGGLGGYVTGWVDIWPVPGDTFTVTIGAGGAGAVGTNAGGSGYNTVLSGNGFSIEATGGLPATELTAWVTFEMQQSVGGVAQGELAQGGGGAGFGQSSGNGDGSPGLTGLYPGFGGGGAGSGYGAGYGLAYDGGGGSNTPTADGIPNTGGGGAGCNGTANGGNGGSGYCELRWEG